MRNEKEEAGCGVCGAGQSPDERMVFTDTSTDYLVRAAYEMLSQAQLQLSSAECVLAKLIELQDGRQPT